LVALAGELGTTPNPVEVEDPRILMNNTLRGEIRARGHLLDGDDANSLLGDLHE